LNLHDDLLLKNIPHILRARGFRLYLADNRLGQMRLVDLWQNGGAVVLGHTPPNLLREIKNTASRGLYAPYPHFTENRFLKALSKLLPGRSFRVYAAPPWDGLRPEELIGAFNRETNEVNGKIAKLWRPFIDAESPFASEDTPLLIPVIPGIQTWRGGLPYGLCVAAVQTETAASNELLSKLPPSDMLPPVILAAATRGVYDLLAAPERAKLSFPRIAKALKKSRWQRNGIYLNITEEKNKEEWASLFLQFLKAGFLIPPDQSQPLILPGEMSAGEEAKLAELLKEDV